MPTVTDIRSQKKSGRANVYLDGKFAFGIDLDNLVLSNIKIGAEFSDEQITEIVKKAEFQKTWEKLLRFAMVRPRSEKEITDWFRRKEVHSSLHPNLIKKLKHLNLLNDIEFAKWWVEQRQTFRPKSLRIMNYELRIKGISQDIIQQVLQETPIDEEKMAKEILSKKEYKWKNLEPQVRKQKITQYLAGKGFSWGVIEKFIK